MKILTINCVSGKGSTGKIISDIEKALSKEFSFTHCYESGAKSGENNYRIANWLEYRFYYVLARLTGIKYSTGFTSTYRLLSYIKKKAPDVVHIHCPNCGTVNLPWLISFLKKREIPTVITNHAEFFYTGNCPHAFDCLKFTEGCGNCSYVFDPYRKFWFDRTAYGWKRMKRAFHGFEKMVAVSVSPWVMSRQKLSPIMNQIRATVIKNGIDTERLFNYKVTDLKTRLNIPQNRKVVLHVTASFSDRREDPKGGYFILELAKRLPSVTFIIVGPSLLTDMVPSENVLLQGRVQDQSLLGEYYSMADVTVLTSRRETFGMICAESLCCGTPVIGFRAGGPESIAMEQYSKFVDYADLDALESLLCNGWLEKKDEMNAAVISEQSKAIYDAAFMAKQYGEVYKTVCEMEL